MKTSLLPLVLIMLLSMPGLARADRLSLPLTDGWRFIRHDVAPDAADASWDQVSVPHTWNALDGQDGKAAEPDFPDGYYRGPAWYARELDVPAEWRGRRVFIRFEAASLVADVYVNGRHVGEHRGGFAAFCFELTPYLQFGQRNRLRVRVDNSRFADVAPLSGDFTVDGGLYRPVHLLVTDPVCLTPLDYATSGVYLTQQRVDRDQAVVEVETKVSNALAVAAPADVQVELLDATGRSLQSRSTEITVAAGQTQAALTSLVIDSPHLWNGRADPYLYHVRVNLRRGGQVIDTVTEPLGLRTIRLDPERGLLLNGRPYAVHGVNRHQELAGKGWALSPADHAADFQMILDLGATAVRLAHYQQSSVVHDLCDRNGLLLWQEIPIVERINDSPAFTANARQQLTEMIRQGYNHPSLACWGLYNELRATWIQKPWPAPEPLIRELNVLAHQLDPSRPTVAATWSPDPLPMHPIPDGQCLNTYPGWYWGTATDLTGAIAKLSGSLGGRRIALSEYGAGANVHQHEEGALHQPQPGGPFHPEEWQTAIHESEWAQIRNNPHLWGSFVWVMFDFASDARNEGGTPGINDKGLVTHDRRIKKDAFYFYQANWSDQPMVHIASRRLTPRHEPVTTIAIFSNCSEVTLRVNGKSLAPVQPDDVHVFRWPNVTLQPGVNHIEAAATREGQHVTDACTWELVPAASP